MTDRAIAFGTRASVRRIGWLFVIVLPVILAACGKGGNAIRTSSEAPGLVAIGPNAMGRHARVCPAATIRPDAIQRCAAPPPTRRPGLLLPVKTDDAAYLYGLEKRHCAAIRVRDMEGTS